MERNRLRLLLLASAWVAVACTSGGGVASSESPAPTAAATSPSPSPNPSASLAPVPVPPTPDPSCQQEPGSHSLNSDQATSFTIANRTSVVLTLFWLDFQGQRVKYFDLAPGATAPQPTFVTHPWVAADPIGNCVKYFLVTAPAQITVG